MSHDIQAAWAATEIADQLSINQRVFFGSTGWSVYAGRESGRFWPITDGVLSATSTAGNKKIALEFKRPNEGLHGILTAMGQALSYLEKGYDATAIVIPKKYTSHADPGEHIKRVLDVTTTDSPITVYTYDDPDTSKLRPFEGKLQCVRGICLPHCKKITTPSPPLTSKITTLWAHMREGMSYPDAFFRFCQKAKLLSINETEQLGHIVFPAELIKAVNNIAPQKTAIQYLSNTNNDSFSEKVWRATWFNYYFWNDTMPIFSAASPYVVNDTPTKILQGDGSPVNLSSTRNDSIKIKLVDDLNKGKITKDSAWEEYAEKIHKYAHSYREVIDSGLYHIGFLEADGKLTELGYKFVDACERIGSANTGIPIDILGAALIENGQYGALLHYIHQLSDEAFAADPFSFTKTTKKGRFTFNGQEYRQWLDDKLTNSLRIRATSTIRAGGSRKAFQAEFGIMKKLGLIHGNRMQSYGIGVGLRVDWPKVQQLSEYFTRL